ncbi:hypothetical protein [Bradyrhizobium elkanii]|uniref:hypothetical protein n=1 Tax=Bradyrhizobium elkanii TaxID=29448 RepID=UPI003511D943
MAKGHKTGGRKKGTPNKVSGQLREMILEAAELAGDEIEKGKGTIAYLKQQAKNNPGPFMSLLGKVLPTQISGDPESPIHIKTESDAQFGAVVGALESLARAKSGGAGGES